MMNPSMVGALLGFGVGLVGCFALRFAAMRIEEKGEVENAKQIASILRKAALADWLIMIVAGFIFGPMLLSGVK